ncbi:hypothetical protein EsDP_00001887 [Epichloe bromicola]|uniref:Mid2 domain-containing protein n=1 Tax=Epichloe bromicola TaxID=79588 RepID=A0ABQ0CJ54_9HYPO
MHGLLGRKSIFLETKRRDSRHFIHLQKRRIRMHLPRSLLFVPVLACPIAAVEKSWPVSNLTLELSHFVPACAEDCFTSFLQANYGLERGREKIPSLQELCSTDGETGFTVGEGAVQCIAAEKSIDGCSDTDASSSVIYNAHQMCIDQPGAITPTHGVITATLLLPPSGAGPVSFPAPSRTARTRSMSRTTGRPSTLVVDTHSLTRTTSSASSTTDTTLGASVSTGTRSAAETSTTTAAAAAAAAGAARAAGSGGSLTPLQKAGISVGVIGFAIIGIGILLLFRLRRAKRKREHKRLPETPSRRDSWGYKFDRNHGDHGGGHTGGDTAWMANSVHPCRGPNVASSIPPVISAARTTTVTPSAASRATLSTAGPPAGPSTTSTSSSAAPPRAYNRASWRPSAIGLAISPAASKNALPSPNSRPISKLLPARPLLTLAIPKKPSTPPIKYAEMPSHRNQSETSSPKYTRVASHPPVLPKLSIVPERHDDSLSVTKTTNKPRESTMTEFEEDGRESSSMSPQGQIWRPPRPPSAVPLSAAAYYVADKHGNWVLGDSKRISQTAELEGTTPLAAHPKLATSMTILPISNNQQKTDQPQSSSNNNAPQPGVTCHAVSHVAFHRPGARRSSSVPNPPAPAPAPAPAQQCIRVVTEPLLKLQDAQDDFVPRPLFSSAPRSSGRSLTRPQAPSADSGITTMTSTSSEDEEDEKHGEPSPNVQQINLPPVAESPRNGNAHAHAHANGHGHGHGRSPVSYPKIPGRETGPTGTRAKLVPPRMPTTTTVNWPPSSPSRAGNTMRLVKPSPEPEPEDDDDDDDDDRTQLPSASVPSQRPRSQLQQPSPFPARQQTWQSPRPRRPSPSWIPGLPAHPHPQRRPRHTSTGPGPGTSTLWLPPQARARAGTLKMETEPDHERPHFRPILSISTDWHTGSAPQPRGLPSSPPWLPPLTPTRRGTDLFLNVR